MRILTILLFTLLTTLSWGWDVDRPAPFIDQAKLIPTENVGPLVSRIQRLADEDDIVLSIVILPSLEGQAIEDASIKIAEKFKLGSKKKGNGMLLLISTGDKKVRVEVGQGIEDVFTDASTSHLIRRIIAPTFKEGQYLQGLVFFTEAVHNLKTTGKIEGNGENPNPYFIKKKSHVSQTKFHLSLGFLLGLIILLPLLSYLSTVHRVSSAIVGLIGFAVFGLITFGLAQIFLAFIVFPLIGLVLGLVGPHNILAMLLMNSMGGGGGYYGGSGGGGGNSSSWGSDGGGFSGGGSSGSW